jgi:hypothetical protein
MAATHDAAAEGVPLDGPRRGLRRESSAAGGRCAERHEGRRSSRVGEQRCTEPRQQRGSGARAERCASAAPEASAAPPPEAPEAAPVEALEVSDAPTVTGSVTQPKPAAPEKEEVVSQDSNEHLDVVARSLKLKKSSRTRLLAIAAHYHAATGKKLTITGGDRDPATQAKLMFQKAKGGEDLAALYSKHHLLRPILAALEPNKNGKKPTEKSAVRAITEILQKQIAAGEFISKHLDASAADVRSRGMTSAQVDALRAAVSRVEGASLFDERESTAPHFHLNL